MQYNGVFTVIHLCDKCYSDFYRKVRERSNCSVARTLGSLVIRGERDSTLNGHNLITINPAFYIHGEINIYNNHCLTAALTTTSSDGGYVVLGIVSS